MFQHETTCRWLGEFCAFAAPLLQNSRLNIFWQIRRWAFQECWVSLRVSDSLDEPSCEIIVKVLKFLMPCYCCCSYSALTSLYFVLLDELTITVFQCILYIFSYNWIYPSISMRFLICRALIWPDACFSEPWCYDSLQSSFSTWSCTCKSTATGTTTSSAPSLYRSAGTAREFRWVWCDWVCSVYRYCVFWKCMNLHFLSSLYGQVW